MLELPLVEEVIPGPDPSSKGGRPGSGCITVSEKRERGVSEEANLWHRRAVGENVLVVVTEIIKVLKSCIRHVRDPTFIDHSA